MEFINAEFNSPYEEFSLVMEMRDNAFGPKETTIKTQHPLAIYVPPERLQLWQTGRSRHKINKITRRHPGINLDILRQYKVIYRWIEGLNIVEAFEEIGIPETLLIEHLEPIMEKAIADLEAKGYVVADMKPSHIIIGEKNVKRLRKLGSDDSSGNTQTKQGKFLHRLIEKGDFSVVDYELLLRTPAHDEQVKSLRRHSYLDDQRDRFNSTSLPPFLSQKDILGVPYVHGHVESTGGLLWVVGRNPHLFDYFLPERWRRTPCKPLSKDHEVFYTVTKDNVHIVWKTSRVGEKPLPDDAGKQAALINEYGINSPFEEFAIAHFLEHNGIQTVYIRAIYMTGSTKIEKETDSRPYNSHKNLLGLDNLPILRKNKNYITIRGFYNGTDSWVASHEGSLFQPFDLTQALLNGILKHEECHELLDVTRARLKNVGFDGTLLELNDIIVSLDPDGILVRDSENFPEARICNFELIHQL
ncbi:hypothetical protein ACFL60_07570 [Candidatus Omnitrophota bacterium]